MCGANIEQRRCDQPLIVKFLENRARLTIGMNRVWIVAHHAIKYAQAVEGFADTHQVARLLPQCERRTRKFQRLRIVGLPPTYTRECIKDIGAHLVVVNWQHLKRLHEVGLPLFPLTAQNPQPAAVLVDDPQFGVAGRQTVERHLVVCE